MRNVKILYDQEWDELVEKTYNRPYCFQQQEGCRDRGVFSLVVPNGSEQEDEISPSRRIPEVVNHDEMGTTLENWLARDPNKPLRHEEYDGEDLMHDKEWDLELWYHRNFYPPPEVLANDLHKKGLLEAGEYVIEIDW